MKKQSVSLLIGGILMAVLYNTFIGIAIAWAFELPANACIAAINTVGFIPSVVKLFSTHQSSTAGLALEGLAREVYAAELIQQYRPAGAWLSRARDLSMYVSNLFGNEVLNLAEAGVDPEVIMNYDHVDPLPVANDEDTPIAIPLHSFSTERSKITESAQETRAYDIMSDRINRHAATQNMNILKYSAYAFAPSANGTYTPVVRTSGATSGGFKKATLQDIIDLDIAMRNLDVDGARILVLNPTHLGHLQSEDKELFKGYVPTDPNGSFKLFGFETYVSTATPRYSTDGAPAVKVWNAANENDDLIASFAFVANEVGRAQGTIKPYFDRDNATYQASFLSTRNRFIAVKIRNKYVASLVNKTA